MWAARFSLVALFAGSKISVPTTHLSSLQAPHSVFPMGTWLNAAITDTASVDVDGAVLADAKAVLNKAYAEASGSASGGISAGVMLTDAKVGGKVQLTNVRFRDNLQLMNICQRIVSQVGRRVDESSPICDARLADGSRVNAVIHPLAIGGPFLTIRKFSKEKLQIDDLIRYGTLNAHSARFLQASTAGRPDRLLQAALLVASSRVGASPAMPIRPTRPMLRSLSKIALTATPPTVQLVAAKSVKKGARLSVNMARWGCCLSDQT